MKQMKTDIAVIGGGAAGLAAASEAARSGVRVLIVERLPRVGKKILLTGNGRCNLGNRDRDPANWNGSVRERDAILTAFGDPEVYFSARGLYCRTDQDGRIYPMSNMAASVLDALRFDAAAHGAETLCDAPVTAIRLEKGGFCVDSEQASVFARKVIFAVGGAAAPSCGTDGSAFSLIRQWHKPSSLIPALAPIKTDPKLVSALKGMRLAAHVILDTDGRFTADSEGEVQFADGALSGICVFDLSRHVRTDRRQTLSLHLLPAWSDEQIHRSVKSLLGMRCDLPAEDLLTGLVPKRVGQVILKNCGISPSMIVSQIPRENRRLIPIQFLCWQFPVRAAASFSAAQVTAGGIKGEDVDENLMSRRCKGLYFAGECLDVDGRCGGFNLQWAWASGVHTGRAAALAVQSEGV